MCDYITLIVPATDADALRALMERHGRSAWPIDNPSLREVLRGGERQYLTTRGHCDCGTVLAASGKSSAKDERKAAQWKRKGWSAAKIARAVEDHRKADSRPHRDKGDSLQLWDAVLADLGQELRLDHAGLFVSFYSGDVATETLKATRHDVGRDVSRWEALSSMKRDEVTIFPLS
jgi:hypothetical protein